MRTHQPPAGSIEEILHTTLPRWLHILIGEDQSRQLATLTNDLRGKVSTSGDGKKITSGFSYWGIGPTIAWTHACTDPFYLVMKESIETFPHRFRRMFHEIAQQKYHYVSLGIGTGQKDRQMLLTLCQAHPELLYIPIDMSSEMLIMGVPEALKGVPIDHQRVLPVQIDFSLQRNVEETRHLLEQIVGDEPLLFSLLGNTLANFEEDSTLLHTIADFLRPQDRLMLEVAYTDTLSVDAVQGAIEEYSRSRAFKEFVTSALLQNTNLCIDSEDISFYGSIDEDKSIQIKVLYQNKASASTRIVLPDRSEIDFPGGDTIRLYLTRKYTGHGIEALLRTCGFQLLTRELSTFSSTCSSSRFGMAAMLLQLPPAGTASCWESAFISYGSPDQPFAERLDRALRERGVDTFFFARDTTPGEKAYHCMSKGVNEYDRTILICSQLSLERLPVLHELDLVLSRESREGGSSRLIPITLDRYLYDAWTPRNKYMRTSVLDRSVCNFIDSDTHDETKFTQALEHLLLALKREG